MKQKKGITLIALVVTIVVLLILASVSITVVFGDDGILAMAKEAAEKTNKSMENDVEDIGKLQNTINDVTNNGWDVLKVTAVTSADGRTVPVPKGFVASSATGENTVSGGFVIYEGSDAVTDANVENARKERNQFVWIPANGVSLRYEQDKNTWESKTWRYNECKDHWTDVETEAEQAIVKREDSVAKYGGFYVGRYEAGVEESKDYKNDDNYKGSAENRNKSEGVELPVTKKERQAWNYVDQTNAKKLSEKMYASSTSVTSRLIDSYAWDTICHWFSDSDINVTDSTSWGNYLDASFKIKGLYAKYSFYVNSGKYHWDLASTYNRTAEGDIFELEAGRTYTDTIEKPRKCYEIETGATIVDENGNEIDRNKAKNIYDFAGNMWEWTTEIEEHNKETHQTESEKESATYAVLRGGCFFHAGDRQPAAHRNGDHEVHVADFDAGFRPVLYLKL